MDYRGEDNMERKGFFITLNIFSIVPMKANYFFKMKIIRACSLLITCISFNLTFQRAGQCKLTKI